MDAAACIGCGACVAACPNASAMLFTSAKISHLALLPQGQPERSTAPAAWSRRWTPRASAPAPTTASARPPARRGSAMEFIARMNADFTKASAISEGERRGDGSPDARGA